MIVAIIGLLMSIAMVAVGVSVIGRRGEPTMQQYAGRVREVNKDVSVGGEDPTGVGVSAEVSFFRGLSKGFELYGEKSTAEILDMIRAGRWGEAWPWAMAALGVLMILLVVTAPHRPAGRLEWTGPLGLRWLVLLRRAICGLPAPVMRTSGRRHAPYRHDAVACDSHDDLPIRREGDAT